MGKIPSKFKLFLIVLIAACLPLSLQAQAWSPANLSSGSGDSSWASTMGYTQEGDDIYISITPTLEIPLGGFKIGLQIPLEVLAYDEDGSTGQEIPSLKKGLFDNYDDLLRMVIYVKYGEHLYFDPDDAFNWSMHYGQMTDGYMGHKTLIYRYVNNYDSTVFRTGLMADINNNWGGVEHFSSDLFRKEVIGWRGYIRPWGLITGVHNLFFAGGNLPSLHQVALFRHNQEWIHSGGVLYQEKIPDQGNRGRVGQHFLPKMQDVIGNNKSVNFREVKDPVTGETHVEAIPADNRTPEEKILDQKKQRKNDKDKDDSSIWDNGFLNRLAIGTSKVEDRNAPLNLESDGSGNLVVDPDTLRPRALDEETVTFTGYDIEFRLSPVRWLDITPYADRNEIEDLDNSNATHVGLDMLFKFGGFKVTFRPEYREFTSNYIPTYFDSYHMLERTIFNPGGEGDSTTGSGSTDVTKLSYLKSLPSDGAITKGYYAQLIFEWVDTIVVETTYEDYDGINNSVVFTGIYLPGIMDIYFNGYYTKKYFDKVEESYEFDDRSLFKAELGYNLFGGITLSVAFQRTWEYNDANAAYEPIDETSYNIGYSSLL